MTKYNYRILLFVCNSDLDSRGMSIKVIQEQFSDRSLPFMGFRFNQFRYPIFGQKIFIDFIYGKNVNISTEFGIERGSVWATTWTNSELS